jgi:hypothetical protein
MNRNAIYDALFALISQGEGLPSVAGVNWPGGNGFQFTSRRVREWNNIPIKPALCQPDFSEIVRKQTRDLPYTHVLGAEWWIFHQGGADPSAVPSVLTNDILDAVAQVLEPPDYEMSRRNTLGGLVYDCYMDGQIMKTSGDLEGEALISVPISILVPR